MFARYWLKSWILSRWDLLATLANLWTSICSLCSIYRLSAGVRWSSQWTVFPLSLIFLASSISSSLGSVDSSALSPAPNNKKNEWQIYSHDVQQLEWKVEKIWTKQNGYSVQTISGFNSSLYSILFTLSSLDNIYSPILSKF